MAMTRDELAWPGGRDLSAGGAHLLIHSRAARLLDKHVPAFRSILESARATADAIGHFPDGSVLIRGSVDTRLVAREALHAISEAPPLNPLVESCHVRRLAGFGDRGAYLMIYPRVYHERLGTKSGLLVYPGFGQTSPSPGEFELDDLSVTVKFQSRPPLDGVSRFVEILRRWHSSVSEHGVFGEGPALVASRTVDFQGLHVRFRIDVSSSGQETVNWLTLLILSYGFDVHPVKAIRYDRETDPNIEEILGKPRGKVNRIPLVGTAQDRSLDEGPLRVAIEGESHVPTHAAPHPRYESKRFRVLESSRCFWDDFVLTVYFGEWPRLSQQEEFRRLLESWFTIGQYGGLGGTTWGKLHSDVVFNDVLGSAKVSADLRGIDESVAIPLLIKVLEGFSTEAPIEAITIGGIADLADEEVGTL